MASVTECELKRYGRSEVWAKEEGNQTHVCQSPSVEFLEQKALPPVASRFLEVFWSKVDSQSNEGSKAQDDTSLRVTVFVFRHDVSYVVIREQK